MGANIRVGALISGGGTNLQAILDACAKGDIPAEVVFVGTDNPQAAGLKRAQKSHIATFCVDYRQIIRAVRQAPYDVSLPAGVDLDELLAKQKLFITDSPEKEMEFIISRVAAEAALLEAMRPYDFDLLVLAGFMRNLSPFLIDRVNADADRPRIMNIHPALLPAFPGTDGYGDTYRYGCKVAGCTVHFIDYGEDSGPIIGQRAYPILPEDSLEDVKRKGLEQEWQLYPECIRLFAENRLQLVRSGNGARPQVNILPPAEG